MNFHATTAWGRHIASRDAWWHAISVVVYGGATITACRGRWPTGDAIESHDNPPENKRCGACVAVLAAAVLTSCWGNQGPVEGGDR